MYEETSRVGETELELKPIRSKGELVVDDWWEVPSVKRDPFLRRHWLAIVTLLVPVALGIVFYGLVASDQYISESRFIVRTSSFGDSANLAALMQDQKITRATDETIAVSEYVTSRDALQELVDHDDLRALLSRPGVDPISRFPNFYSRDNMESLYRRFRDFAEVSVVSDSGIATLRVRAFTPDDALRINRALIKDAELFVNRLNSRAYGDTLAFANRAVEEERAKFTDIEARLTQYRKEQQVIDPNREAAAALARQGALMTTLSQAESALGREIAEAPQGPQIASLRSNVESLRAEINKQRYLISGSSSSLAGKFSAFDQLMLERQFASQELESALNQLNKARRDLEQQQYYLQTVVEPNLPDQALYPRRIVDILMVFGISLCVYGIGGAILRNIGEHRA